MTENEKRIIEGLIARDEKVTNDFFYAQCKPMLSSVAREVFMEELNYDEEEDKVMLFNPAFGDIPLTVSSETFLDAWEDSGNYTIEISKQKFS